jgi:hypothetical protein
MRHAAPFAVRPFYSELRWVFIVLVEMRDEVWCRVMATLMMVVVSRGFALLCHAMRLAARWTCDKWIQFRQEPLRTTDDESSNSGAF